jgi:hypothetical protein
MFRNKIINGDMRIDQRNSGASITIAAATSTYSVDRIDSYATGASKISIQRNAGSVTPPAGFVNYVGVTSLAATTVTSTDLYRIGTCLEGYTISDLAWGTASAKTVTLSFYVYSSLTGNFSVCLQNAANSRAYPILYNIPSANTWTRISIVIPGETSGTWDTTNGMGCRIQWGLGVGSTKTTTSGAWANGDYNGATGAVNVVSTNAATFYLTGLQFEIGSVATPFEFRPYGSELALCQRYFNRFWNGIPQNYGFLVGFAINTTSVYSYTTFPIMRATPTATVSAGSWTVVGNAGTTSVTSITVVTPNSLQIFTTGSGYSAWTPYYFSSNSATNLSIDLSAEIG